MTRFRKKPVVVEAEQLTIRTQIETFAGTRFGEPGDWLVTGSSGESYLYEKDLFEATYELIDSAECVEGSALFQKWRKEVKEIVAHLDEKVVEWSLFDVEDLTLMESFSAGTTPMGCVREAVMEQIEWLLKLCAPGEDEEEIIDG